MAEQHSTIWIYFICLSIQLMDTWVISTFGYYDLCCNENHAQFFDRYIFSIILHINQIAGSHVNVYLTLRNCLFLNNLYHFIFPPAMYKDFNFYTSLSILLSISYYSILVGSKCYLTVVLFSFLQYLVILNTVFICLLAFCICSLEKHI